MSIRDLLLNVLIAIGLTFVILFVAAADSLPMWFLAVFAILVWVVYIVLVIRDHQRDIRYPLVRIGRPHPAERPYQPTTRRPKAPQSTVYDQKEDQ